MNVLSRIIQALLGTFQWQAPLWLVALAGWGGRHRRGVALGALLLAGVLLAVWGGWRYWLTLPKPALTQVVVSAPGVSRVDDEGRVYPQPLQLRFSIHYPDPTAEGPRTVASLQSLDQELTGIRLHPAHAGSWRWRDENTLVFSTEQDWPADQAYRIELPADIFAEGVRLENNQPQFETPPFVANLDKLEFYRDPETPSRHQAIATLRFSHAVSVESLQQQVRFAMRPSGSAITVKPQHYDYSVALGRAGREAYLKTHPLALPEEENFMTLEAAAGIRALDGNARSAEKIERNLRIPSVSSFFRVTSLAAQIITNEQGDPEQTLVIELTDGVNASKLAADIEAWVLPQNYHHRGGSEIDEAVLKRSQKLTLQANPGSDDFNTLHSFRFRAPENRRLLVRLPAGLESRGGFRMNVPYAGVLQAPSFPREVSVVGDGTLLALSGEQQLGFQTRGVQALEVEIHQLFEDQLAHLVSQTHGRLKDVSFHWNFSESHIGVRHVERLGIAETDPAKVAYASLDLAPRLKNLSADKGVFVVNVYGLNANGHRTGHSDRRLVLVTDMAVISKRDAANNNQVYVFSLERQQPLAGATVSLLGLNGRPVLTRTTDASGRADFPNVSDYQAERRPVAWLVKQGQDLVFMPFDSHERSVNYSRFATGGVYTGRSDGNATIRALAFSDRGIYRPGEKGNLAIISKRDDWQVLPASPVEILLHDPRGNLLHSERQRLSKDGLQEVAFALTPNAPTGQYQVTINLISDDRYQHRTRIGSTAFSVEEFQPDTLRINAKLDSKTGQGWHNSLAVDGQVTLENLFGLPAQERRVQGSYTLAPVPFSFKQFEGFVFDNPLREQRDTLQRQVTENLPEQTSDSNGKATFAIDLSGYGSGLYQLTLDVQGYDSGGGRSVQARSRLLVSPLAVLAGSKAEGDLHYIHRGSERKIRFLLINSSLESLASEAYRVRVQEVQQLSTLVRQRDGTLAYQSISRNQAVSEKPFSIAVGGSDWTVPSDMPGDFIAELLDETDQVVARRHYSVAGARNVAGNLEKNSELQLKLDRTDYRAGDTIEMQINAPYTGMGLITIERNRVLAQQWFRTDSQRTVQHIRVPEGIEGNAYVNVTFVRALDSDEIFTSPMSVAVQSFNVDRSKREIAIKLQAPEKVQPGETLKVSVSTSRPGQLLLYAVDEGILQVANYQTPAPLDTFLKKRALEVSTWQIADMLLPEFSLLQRAAAGGDAARLAAEMALGQNLNPFQRHVRAPVVFWSGIKTVAAGEQVIDIPIPDYFDGQLRIMAVASNAEGAGVASRQAVVRGAFVLSPNLITAVAPGDEFDVSLGVANALEAEQGTQQIAVTVSHDQSVVPVGEITQSLQLAPGSEGRVQFRFRASDKLGGGELVFRAGNDNFSSRRSATLSVRPAVPYRTSAITGVAEQGKAQLTIERILRPELADQTVLSGYSPLVLAHGLEQYLHYYPHVCSEQIVSQVFPTVAMMADPGSDIVKQQALERFARVASTLATRQAPAGGFSFWPGSNYVDDQVSVYALHFLLEAREQGLPVSAEATQKAADYLRRIAAAEPQRYSSELQAYAIYVMVRSGIVATNYLTQLHAHLDKTAEQQWQKTLAGAWMAASYRLLKLDELAEQIIGRYQFDPLTAQYNWNLDSALARNAQYLFILAKHFPEQLQKVKSDALLKMVEPISKGDFNTFSASWSVMALSAWGEQAADAPPEVLKILAENKEKALQELARSQPGETRLAVEVAGDISKLLFEGDQKHRFFYSLSQAGYDTELPEAAVKAGLEVHRVYLNASGEEVTRAAQGDELTVRLTVRSLDGLNHQNVALIDLLPGGFEVLRESVRGTGQEWTTDYVDIREDRLVMYGTVNATVRRFEYRVKVTGSGNFVVPPPFAESMYHRHLHAQGVAGRFVVDRP